MNFLYCYLGEIKYFIKKILFYFNIEKSYVISVVEMCILVLIVRFNIN